MLITDSLVNPVVREILPTAPSVFVTSLLYNVFLTTSLSTTLVSFLRSVGTFAILSTSALSTLYSKLSKLLFI